MAKAGNIQEPFLNVLRKERIAVSIYLVNGIKLQGKIESYDPYIILLKNGSSQIVYKHAISTIVAEQPIKIEKERERERE